MGRAKRRFKNLRKPWTVAGGEGTLKTVYLLSSSSLENRRSVMLLPTPVGPATKASPPTSSHISSPKRISRWLIESYMLSARMYLEKGIFVNP